MSTTHKTAEPKKDQEEINIRLKIETIKLIWGQLKQMYDKIEEDIQRAGNKDLFEKIQKINLDYNENAAYKKIIQEMSEPFLPASISKAQRAQKILSVLKLVRDFQGVGHTLRTELEGIHTEFRSLELVSHLGTPPSRPDKAASAVESASAAKKGKEAKEDIDEEEVKAVIEKLKRLEEHHVAKVLAEQFSVYRQVGNSEQGINAAKYVKDVISFPLWKVRDADPRDQYKVMSMEEIIKEQQQARKKIEERNLVGTEKLTEEVLKAANNLRMKMFRTESKKGKESLEPGVVGAMPVICIDGPPGTGKTTIVKLLAEALDMGFYDVSMAGQDDPKLVYGHGLTWKSPGPGLVAEAMIKTNRERVLILLDEAEKTKDKALQDAFGQILEANQKGYRDEYFGTTIDKRKVFFVLTTNYLALLPAHIRSRVTVVTLPGYTDETKIKIMKNMVVSQLGGHLHKMIKFASNDKADLESEITLEGEKVRFKGFRMSKDGDDVIKFIVENYITERGVREASALLAKVISHATTELTKKYEDFYKLKDKAFEELKRSKDFSEKGKEEFEKKWNEDLAKKMASEEGPIIINRQMIIDALGQPDPSVQTVKKLNQDIEEKKKTFTEIKDKVTKIIDALDAESLTDADKKTNIGQLGILIPELLGAQKKLIKDETAVIKALRALKSKTDYTHEQIKEHEESIRDTNDIVNDILKGAAQYLTPAEIKALGVGPITSSPRIPLNEDEAAARKKALDNISSQITAKQDDPSALAELKRQLEEQSRIINGYRMDAKANEKDPTQAFNHYAVLVAALNQRVDSLQRDLENFLKQQEKSKDDKHLAQPTSTPEPSGNQPTSQPSFTQLQAQLASNQKQLADRQRTASSMPSSPPSLGVSQSDARPSVGVSSKEESQTMIQKLWGYFIHRQVVKTVNTLEPTVSVRATLTPKEFKEVCENLGRKTKSSHAKSVLAAEGKIEPGAAALAYGPSLVPFEGLQGKFRDGSNDTVFELKRPENPEPELTITHKKEKIDITASELVPTDDVLLNMIIAVKEMGKKTFDIQDCKDNPTVALKLYLLGKSLGLEPILDLETKEKIKSTHKDDEGFDLGAIYEQSQKTTDTNEIREFLKQQQERRERPQRS